MLQHSFVSLFMIYVFNVPDSEGRGNVDRKQKRQSLVALSDKKMTSPNAVVISGAALYQ